MKSMADLIREHPFIDGLDEAIIALIAGCAKNVVFKAGDYILREGADAEYFYLIREGTVALETYAPGRGPITFLTLKHGDILGASWLVPPYRWNHDARATETTRAIAFECKCLRDKCEADHHVGYEMMKLFIPPLVDRMRIARLQSADVYGDSKV